MKWRAVRMIPMRGFKPAFLYVALVLGAGFALDSVYLGLLFAGLTFLVNGPVGLGAGLLSGWLSSHPKALGYLYRTSGAALGGLGIKLAFKRRA